MNDDDHGTVLPATDYRYAQNIHIMQSADGGMAAIKNVPGTTEVEFSLAGTSGLQVVGSVEDEENNRVFYFVKATTGNDEILCYNRTSNTIQRVLGDGILTSVDGQAATLGLSADYLITGVAFVYPWLFWTDDNEQPRRVNVERGMRTYLTTYVSPDGTAPTPYSVPINYKDISIIREPPRYPIETRKLLSTDEADIADQTTNQIALYSFQFSYRFLYRDGSLSVLAPYSKLVPFNIDTAPDAFDTVEVKIPKRQNIPNEVDEIQILVRDPQTNNWGIIKRYRRQEDVALYNAHNSVSGDALAINFFNTYASTLIQEAEGIKPFDSVPLKSKAMEVAQNRLFLANNLEGYDPIDSLILSAERAISNEALPAASAEYIYVFPNTNTFDPAHFAVIVVLIQTGDPTIDGYYEYQEVDTYSDFSNGNLPDTIYLNPYNKIGDLGDFDPFNTGLIDYYSDVWGVSPPNGPGPGINAFVDDTYTGTQPTVFGLGNFGGIEDGDLILKSGSRYQIGLVFYDYAGRNNGVYTNDDCIIEVPERPYTDTEFTTGITWLIDGVVNNNNIPLWATHYSIVRTKNLTTNFFAQGIVNAQAYVEIDVDGNYNYVSTYPTNSEVFAIAWDIHLFYASGLGYTYAEGDVLKFWEEDDSEPKQYAIIGQDGRYIWTRPEDIGSLVANKIGRAEIYTPIRTTDQPLFYEVGETYPIDNAGTISKSFSVYSGVLRGDVYFMLRPTPNPAIVHKTESMSPNADVWQVWNTDAGRPNVVLLDSKQERRKTAIRWSNQYVAGAKINGLCSFDEVDELVLEEAVGPIQKLVLAGKLQAEGTVMLSIGTNSTYSMYLGERQIIDNSDQSLLATSGQVIGTTRDLRGGYGTNHPESVVENDGRVYWYDEQRGAVVRYAVNGLVPISDYKFRSFFNRLSGQTRGKDVIGGFDRLRSEYLLSVQQINADNDVEYLMDYDGEVLATGSTASNTVVTSMGVDVLKGVEYDIEINFTSAGTFKLYLITDTLISLLETEVVEESVTETVTFTPPTNGVIGYTFEEIGFPARGGEFTLIGPRISPHQAWRGQDLTIAFRDIDGMEGWSSFYSFQPEWFARSGNLLLSFVNGKLYRHDNEDAYNTFYGIEYTSGIAWVVSQPAALIKWAAAIGIQSNYTPTWVHIRTENPYIQSSDLEDEDFRFREGLYYGEIRRDRLSPNESGSFFDKSLKGDKMRSSLLEVYAEFSTFADELYVYLVKTMWQQSKGHF